MIATDSGYLCVTDPDAVQDEDRFQDVHGVYQRVDIARLSESVLKAVRKAIDENIQMFRDALHRRPGVVIGELELPLDWHEWDSLRRRAWRGT